MLGLLECYKENGAYGYPDSDDDEEDEVLNQSVEKPTAPSWRLG